MFQLCRFMSFSTALTSNRKSLIGATLLSLTPLVFSTLATQQMVEHQAYLQTLSLVEFLPFILVSVVTMALAMTPSTFVALSCGFFMGWASAPFMVLAYLVASALGFALGRLLDGGHLMETVKAQPKVSAFLSGLALREWPLMVLVRLSPVVPFALMNLLMPALKIRFFVFILAGFVGMLPRTLFSIWLGIQASDMLSLLQGGGDNSLAPLLVTGLTVISVGGLVWVFQRVSAGVLSAR